MIIDSSALLAIVLNEPERDSFLDAIVSVDRRSMSVANWFEATMVIDRRGKPIHNILDVGEMDHPWRSGHTQRFTQEGGLLAVALHQMNRRPWPVRQSASQDHSRKAAAASQIHPDLRVRSEVQELQ